VGLPQMPQFQRRIRGSFFFIIRRREGTIGTFGSRRLRTMASGALFSEVLELRKSPPPNGSPRKIMESF
jgi:hypothetical protein